MSRTTARLDQEKRHDCLDPATASAFFRRGLRRRFAKPADAAGGRRYRSRHGQIRRAAVPRAGYHRRPATGLCPQFRRARKCARRHRHQEGRLPADIRTERCLQPRQGRQAAGVSAVSNRARAGKPLPRDHRTHLFNLGNCLWHSDSSFRPIPAKFSLLSARVVNPKGGNTEFADMRAAYDALEDDTKAEIEDMICEHSLMYSRGSLGFFDYSEEEKQMFKPVRQRLVRTHPVHRRKSLYLSSHAGAIVGMSVPEARLLLRDLTEHATQAGFVYAPKWALHDLVVWDNRQTMHRVRRYDQSQPRDMRRATVAGTEPTVAQQAAE